MPAFLFWYYSFQGLIIPSRAGAANLPLPTNNGGPYVGELTYYDPALGACGITSSSSEAVCAVSKVVFDAASTGPNPNTNPLCGRKIRLRRNGKSVDVTVVDRCEFAKACLGIPGECAIANRLYWQASDVNRQTSTLLLQYSNNSRMSTREELMFNGPGWINRQVTHDISTSINY